MFISSSDATLSLLFAIGLFQLTWLSVVLVRKGINPSLIRTCLMPLFAIWVFIWPAYENTAMPLLSLTLLLFPILFALRKESAFARHLRLAWHSIPQKTVQPPPWMVIMSALLLAATMFYQAPELGLGMALALCLAWSAAELMDKAGKGIHLGLANNPTQTLAGHILLVIGVSLLCAWALQLYHGIAWHTFVVATTIVGLITSILRALVAQGWNMPLATLGMGITLWLL